ncbi:hypothetical protein GPECTOR_21g652 [Gonium pectorale]|uniref:PDZ domain-containing protein n=1 Tax=Gonium pectorale TaxID=33097 RepID=A0A150GHW2_GONPE|nr:hypothetical protein GPECTOR_21g652 [Gonium pectorale]|eukprot:KXZ49426.1 hypothetical protein GPECTOR_21g652 [Gonium pectorale]
MAFQKFSSQTWMERYDEEAAEMFGGQEDDDDDDDGGGGGGGGGEEGGSGPPGQDYGDEDAENIGYLVPAPLLRLVLEDYARDMAAAAAAAASSSSAAAAAASSAAQQRGRGAAAGPGPTSAASAAASAAGARRRGRAAASPLATRPPAAAAAKAAAPAPAAPLYLDGRPRLGLRYQRMESPALRRALGLPGSGGAAGGGGVLVTGVDPTGSAAGVVQVHDVLLAVEGRPVAPDGTTLLRPGQRVLFGHWAAVGRVGGELSLTVMLGLRDAGAPFLPVSLGPGRRPQHMVVGPLVFTSFSLAYWYSLMASHQRLMRPGAGGGPGAAARRAFQAGLVPVMGALEWGLPEADDDEEVVLLTERFLRIELEPSPAAASASAAGPATGSESGGPAPCRVGPLLVLDACSLAADTRAVLKHHSMGAAMGAELRRRLGSSWPFEGQQAAQGASRQRRQQGRRGGLAGRR